ncbi:MAG TPA: BON domain-containing protein [Burkholderiales bacterium]|jgi:osmotically-inducible protein OsmY|nr:BON domain-containing protein [Burkholderiales bacterium]
MKLPIRLIAVILALFPFLQSCAPLLIGAGVGAGVMMADDRRTSASILEDQTIEIKAKNRINEKYDDQLHVSVTCFNRFVLLTGETPTEEIKQDLTIVVLEVQNVRNVQNEVTVAGNSSLTSRSSDALLTSRIKGRLTQNKDVSSNHVKVVTENGTAFLMGLVTRAEAEAAAQTAATTSGAQRVVKVFEYID